MTVDVRRRKCRPGRRHIPKPTVAVIKKLVIKAAASFIVFEEEFVAKESDGLRLVQE
jgi:hypothetical protein